MKRCAFGLLSVLVAGCTPVVPLVVISPTDGSETKATTAAEVRNRDAVTPRDGAGAIVVTRATQWKDRNCVYDLSLDDQHVAGLRPGERLTLFADPGERVVGISIRGEDDCKARFFEFPVRVIQHATNRVKVAAGRSADLEIELDSHGGALPP